MTSFKDLSREVIKAAEVIKSKEEFLTHSLALRAKKASEQYPYDQPIVTAANVLSSMAEKKIFITRAELNSIYERLCSTSSKLGDVFATELDRGSLVKSPQYYNRIGEQEVNDYDVVSDPVLKNAFASLFDNGQIKLYSEKMASSAEKACNTELFSIGFAPKKVSVLAGQEDYILCRAEYETPKGMASVIVPVEMKKEAAMLPTMFLGMESFVELKPELLRQHIVSIAGKSFHADGQKILAVLSESKHGMKKIASEVELAVIAMNTDRGQSMVDVNGIVGMKLVETVSDVQDPVYEKTAEHFEFAKRVTSPDGAARFIFNNRVVEAGRDIIIRKMAQYGYPNVQVKVAGCEENKINYAIGIGVNTGILAPVEVVGNNVFPPKVAIASGVIKAFSKDGIKELVDNTKSDTRVIAAASMSAGLKPSELLQQVKDAVHEGNLIKAEDAINVLGEIDKNAQKIAIAILMNSLSDPMAGSSEQKEAIVDRGKMIEAASKKVRDIPVMNTYNIFYPSQE